MEVLTIMQVQIKFTASGCSAVTGNFAPGDLLRTSAEMARHLVEDAKCAEYVGKAAPKATGEAAPAPTKRAKSKPANTADQADEGTAP